MFFYQNAAAEEKKKEGSSSSSSASRLLLLLLPHPPLCHFGICLGIYVSQKAALVSSSVGFGFGGQIPSHILLLLKLLFRSTDHEGRNKNRLSSTTCGEELQKIFKD